MKAIKVKGTVNELGKISLDKPLTTAAKVSEVFYEQESNSCI